MGAEAVCTATVGGRTVTGKARLETDALDKLGAKAGWRASAINVPDAAFLEELHAVVARLAVGRVLAVMAAGKTAGLVDVKVVSFSATHTAEKCVIPLAARPRP